MDVSDYVSIIGLASRYAQALDARDWTELGNCFTTDAVAEYSAFPAALNGRAEIVAAISDGIQKFDVTQHLVGSPTVELDGDSARGTFYVMAQHIVKRGDGDQAHCFVGVIYSDEFSRGDAGWEITHRITNRLWTEGDASLLVAKES